MVGAVIVYALNPGSTSTKIGLATVVSTPQGGVSATVEKHEVPHPELAGLTKDVAVHATLDGSSGGLAGSLDAGALARVRELVADATRTWPKPDAVSARGGLVGPVAAGTYRVTPELASYSLASPYGQHAANAGASIALEWATAHGVPAYVVDPPTVDELLPEARVTGVPGLERRSRFHALNARAVARRAAREVNKRFVDATVVVAHLGGGASVTTFEKGRAADTTGALLDEGPFSPQRAGALPLEGMLDLAYSRPRPELERLLTRESGFRGLVGTADLRELEAREPHDPLVALAVAAFVHAVAKNVGAHAAVGSRPDAIAFTGGVARWRDLMERLERRLSWIAPVMVIPGELELEALAEGAGRVLFGLEEAREWRPVPLRAGVA